jgi:hypothetical protein
MASMHAGRVSAMHQIFYQRLPEVVQFISSHGNNGIVMRQRSSSSGFVGKLCLANVIFRRLTALLLTLAVLGSTGATVTADQQGLEKNQAVRADGNLEFLDSAGKVRSTITIEIADTEELRNRGLMWRTGLDETMGMLFIFDKAQPLALWMRNTPTALDIIFLSTEKKVINIAENTSPLSDTIYRSQAPAQYVVEVPAGFCRRHRVVPGMAVQWRRIR